MPVIKIRMGHRRLWRGVVVGIMVKREGNLRNRIKFLIAVVVLLIVIIIPVPIFVIIFPIPIIVMVIVQIVVVSAVGTFHRLLLVRIVD